MKTNGKVSVVEQTADVDFLTVTVKDREARRVIFMDCKDYMLTLKNEGFVCRPWGMKGYKGWKCAGLRWGSRKDSDIVMLSGEQAKLNWDRMINETTNPTRIDLAMTITALEPRKDIAWSAYEEILQAQREEKTRVKKATFFTNNAGGQTVYVGSRASDQMGRIYDKGREMSGKRNEVIPQGKIWRYEVEFKAYRARRVIKDLKSSGLWGDKLNDAIGSMVVHWFLSRAVSLPFELFYDDLHFSTELSATVTDDQKTLEWLSTQVSPSVKRLLESDKKEEVLVALGLELDTMVIA
jgi:DNA relaxase NicK